MTLKSKVTLLICIFPLAVILYKIREINLSIILNSFLALTSILIFFFLDKRFFSFSSKTYTAILIFMILSLLFGRLGGYEKIRYYDKFLHFSSGFILFATGKEIYKKIDKKSENTFIIKIFSFFVAVSGAAFWEIFEFFSDLILKTNAQNNSLTDTMLDIISGTLSALISLLI